MTSALSRMAISPRRGSWKPRFWGANAFLVELEALIFVTVSRLQATTEESPFDSHDIAKIMLWAILSWPGIGAKPVPTWQSVASHDEAQTVFLDECARLIDDPDHPEDEDRFLLLGYRFQGRSDRQSLLPAIRLGDPVDLRRARDRARRESVLESQVRKEYDFSKSRKNPYAKQLKSQITIRLDTAAVGYFKQMAAELGMPYQNLINLFLRDCAMQKRRPTIQWPAKAVKQPVAR